MPYVDEELLCKVQSKVRKSGLSVRIAWKNPHISFLSPYPHITLRHKLIRSSLSKPKCPGGQRCHTCASGFSGDCTQKNVVYRLNCKLCQERSEESTYIGETKRPVRLRFNEHIRDARNASEGTTIGDHFKERHSAQDIPSTPLQIQILHRSRDHPDRKITESLLIQRNRPGLNSNLSMGNFVNNDV